MKAIMISIKPKWVAKILNGEKTIEIRKTMPKSKLPIDVYIYCTFPKKHHELLDKDLVSGEWKLWYGTYTPKNGKVVAKFTLNKVEEIKFTQTEWCGTKEMPALQVLDNSCLSVGEIMTYLKNKNGKGYAIHISDLKIFDKPKELSEFVVCTAKNHTCVNSFPYPCKKCVYMNELTKAPQNFCYVEEK